MAGAETITNRILDDARQEARRQLDTARERVEEIRSEAKRQAEIIKEAAKVSRAAETAAQSERLHNMASLERRKAALAARRELLDEAFARALKKLEAMSADEYAKLYAELLRGAARDGDVIVKHSADARFTEAILTASGHKGLRLVGEPNALGGGCVIRRGGMEINATLPMLLAQARAQYEGEVAEILFSNARKEG